MKIPPEFVRATIAREEEASREWIAGLPGIVQAAGLDADRARRWSSVRLVGVSPWSESIGHGRDATTCRRLLAYLDWESV